MMFSEQNILTGVDLIFYGILGLLQLVNCHLSSLTLT